MEMYNDEQTKVMEQPNQEVAIEQENKDALETSASLGKFKDVNALLEAYNNLESEFTKRCQKVKELEAKLTVADKEQSPARTESKSQELSSEEKDDVLKSYLREVLSKKQRAIVLDGAGIGVKTPAERPKTLEQAGILAKDLLNKHL